MYQQIGLHRTSTSGNNLKLGDLHFSWTAQCTREIINLFGALCRSWKEVWIHFAFCRVLMAICTGSAFIKRDQPDPWIKDQIKNHSQALPHDTKFRNCTGEIVDSRAFSSWSLIHGSSWSGLIKAEPGRFHPCHYGLLHWQWSNHSCSHMIAGVQPSIPGDAPHKSTRTDNITETKQNITKSFQYFMGYTLHQMRKVAQSSSPKSSSCV